MIRARSIISAGCLAVTLAFGAVGCATSSSGTQHAKVHPSSCDGCTLKVVDQVPLPVSTDMAVVRLDQSWLIAKHDCTCCESPTPRFFADATWDTMCEVDAVTGLCSLDQHNASVDTGLAQLSR